MKSLRGLILLAFISLEATPWTLAHAASTLDTVPRTAVMSAFEPEWTALQTMLVGRKDYVIDGTTFATGTIENKPVVLFLSGVSMVRSEEHTSELQSP